MQEVMITAAVLFQRFDFEFVDKDYKMQYAPHLNRKAKDLFVYARLREGNDVLTLQRDMFGLSSDVKGEK